ncbi:MAG: DNA methyltransferase, partial [Rhodobacteraceae bacterium]|nr:DNA methyltransferase [Paracoccaceae bacterium]
MTRHAEVEALARRLLRPRARVKLFPGDCRDVLPDLGDGTAHMVLTDPPHFLGRGKEIVSSGLPPGMEFDPVREHGLRDFMVPVAGDLLRILKPGAFALVFYTPRIMHRMAVAFEDAGFEVIDLYAWRFTRRTRLKASPLDRRVEERKDMTASERRDAVRSLAGRKTPELQSRFEAVLCARKPPEGTLLDNWLAHGTGLMDAGQVLRGKVPSTVMTCERDDGYKYGPIGRSAPKPVRLCEHLVRLFTKPGQVVI